MRGAHASSFALACALAACAGPVSEEPKVAESPAAEPAAPLSPERQRLERWKEGGAAVDPREGFARAAAEEAERRRSEAIARGAAPGASSLEAEMRGQQLEELASWEGGCFAAEPDFSGQDDWIPHRELTRDDFREDEQAPDAVHAASVPGARLEAYVAIRLACVASARAFESDGQFTVELESVRFFALLSRERSWWSRDARGDPEWTLRHEQLHFDVAELFAEEQNARSAEIREATRQRRPDPDAAAYAFRARLAAELAAQQRSFEETEQRYDRETLHGSDLARQTEWFARVTRGLGAVRER